MTVADLKVEKIRSESVAKGAIYLMAAQFVVLIGGYLMHAYLGRTLGPASYGVFGVVMALLVWFEVSLTGAFPYAIRKIGAEDRALMNQIASTALLGQFIYSLALFALIEAFAPLIASALGDPGLTLLIRVASLDIPVYAAYFCYLGVLNGSGGFSRQSTAAIAYSGSKLVAVVGLVALGVGVKGAFIGNAAASVVGLASARLLAGSVRSEIRYPMRKMMGFVAGTAMLAVIYTLLISMDIFIVEALISDKTLVGMYVAAATLAKAPFFLFLAITNVTLPSVSRALASDDNSLVKRYVGQSFRLHLMLLMPLTAIVSAASRGIVSLIYKSGYAGASVALSILITAFMFWGLLNGVNNIMLARRQTVYPVVSTMGLIALMILLCLKMIPAWSIVGAAAAAVVTGGIGLLFAVLAAYKQGGFYIPGWSVVRIILASAVAYAVARMARTDAVQVLCITSAAVVVYFITLILSGEITKKDIFSLAGTGRF